MGIGRLGFTLGTQLRGVADNWVGEPRPRCRPASPRPRPLESRPLLSLCTESRDPGRASGVWLGFLYPRGTSSARYKKSRAVPQPG